MNFAIVDLEEHYSEFEEEFTIFFDKLIQILPKTNKTIISLTVITLALSSY